jgi:uncharacterized Zn finger protein
MARWNNYDDYYPRYVPAAERKQEAQAKIKKLIGKGVKLSPVVIEGRAIAKTFWGKAWCDNVESYHDYESRLPRGRSYVRQGAVIDLQIEKGRITAKVQGSELYEISISIKELPGEKWELIKKSCAGKIASLIDLIQGKLSPEIIALLCRKDEGLFPSPKEIKLICNCPDWADLCKHLAAVLYGVGARLDAQPELFFLLRGVDQNELFSAGFANDLADSGAASTISGGDLGSIFGIELDNLDADAAGMPEAPVVTTPKKRGRPAKPVKTEKNATPANSKQSSRAKLAKSVKTAKAEVKGTVKRGRPVKQSSKKKMSEKSSV